MQKAVRGVRAAVLWLSWGTLIAQYAPQIPMPPIGHRKKTTQAKQGKEEGRPTIQAEGIVRSNGGDKLVIGSDDGRTFTIALTDKTAYEKAGKAIPARSIVPGATVQVEASADEEQNLTAVRVELLKDPAPEAAGAPPASTETEPEKEQPSVTILQSSPDAPNRPVLHRGTDHRETNKQPGEEVGKSGGGAKRPDEEDDGVTVEPDPAMVPKNTNSSTEDLITRAREWVSTFSIVLPNFVCQQSTTRYQEESKQAGWQALDVVTAHVVYEDGKESYRDITVGGKKTNKNMEELGGSTSTGEFATTLRSLFAPGSRAKFKLAHTTHMGQTDAAIYDFSVELQNSDWRITVGGQSLRPAYSGSVWIDKNTAEVRRIEMEANKIPTDFPLDALEWAVDYDKVFLGTTAYLLPVHAENLGCQRGSTVCMKNAIDFRNYHKFSGESTIQFER